METSLAFDRSSCKLWEVPLQSGQAAELRAAGRRLAAGLVASPMLVVADDRGLLGALVRLDLDTLTASGLTPWLWLGFFAAVGAGFARLFPAHRPRARGVFFAAAFALDAAYWAAGGLRLSVVIAVVLLALGLVSWSVAGDAADPAP